MQVEVWADIICPWCGLGTHRLEAALERFPHRDAIFSVEDLVSLAGEIGLDPEDAREALLSHRYAARVADEGREAARLGVAKAPLPSVRGGVAGCSGAETLGQSRTPRSSPPI